MAKEKKIELKDCKKCLYSELFKSGLYCNLKMIDYKVYTQSSKVVMCDCLWFKIKGNK